MTHKQIQQSRYSRTVLAVAHRVLDCDMSNEEQRTVLDTLAAGAESMGEIYTAARLFQMSAQVSQPQRRRA